MSNKLNYTTILDVQKYIYDNELSVFSFYSLEQKLKKNNLSPIMENLAKKGLIERLEKGKYVVRNFRDSAVIGSFVSNGGSLSYWSALHYHNLILQFPDSVFIQTKYQKKSKNYFGLKYRFIQVKDFKVFGNIEKGNLDLKFRVTDIEKTIIDCFDLPEYSGGYYDLIRAFKDSELNPVKMFDYAVRMNNISLIKRIAYFSEIFNKPGFESFRSKAINLVNSKYNLLDPFGQNKGNFISKWKLRNNIDEKLLEGL